MKAVLNDIVRVKRKFISGDAVPTQLEAMQLATVKFFDKDGDAHIYMPELANNGGRSVIIVFSQDFVRLERLVHGS